MGVLIGRTSGFQRTTGREDENNYSGPQVGPLHIFTVTITPDAALTFDGPGNVLGYFSAFGYMQLNGQLTTVVGRDGFLRGPISHSSKMATPTPPPIEVKKSLTFYPGVDEWTTGDPLYGVTLSASWPEEFDFTASGTLNAPYTLDIYSGDVPEPSTWFQSILGLGLTGTILRKRRQRLSHSYGLSL